MTQSQCIGQSTYSANSKVSDWVHDMMTVRASECMTAQDKFHLRVHFIPILAQPSEYKYSHGNKRTGYKQKFSQQIYYIVIM